MVIVVSAGVLTSIAIDPLHGNLLCVTVILPLQSVMRQKLSEIYLSARRLRTHHFGLGCTRYFSGIGVRISDTLRGGAG